MRSRFLAASLALVAALTPPARAQEQFQLVHGVGAYQCVTGGYFQGRSLLRWSYVDCSAWPRDCAGLCEAARGCTSFSYDGVSSSAEPRRQCVCLLWRSGGAPASIQRGGEGEAARRVLAACQRTGGAANPVEAVLPQLQPYRYDTRGCGEIPSAPGGYYCCPQQVGWGTVLAQLRNFDDPGEALNACRGACERTAGCAGVNLNLYFEADAPGRPRISCSLMGSLRGVQGRDPAQRNYGQWCMRVRGAVPVSSSISKIYGREAEFGPAGANGYKCLDGQIALGREAAAGRIAVGAGAAGIAQCRARCEGSAGCLGFNLAYGGAEQRGGGCVVMLSIHAVEPSAPGAPNSAPGAYCNRLAGPVPGSSRDCPPDKPGCVPPGRAPTDPRPPTIDQPGMARPPAQPPPGKK